MPGTRAAASQQRALQRTLVRPSSLCEMLGIVYAREGLRCTTPLDFGTDGAGAAGRRAASKSKFSSHLYTQRREGCEKLSSISGSVLLRGRRCPLNLVNLPCKCSAQQVDRKRPSWLIFIHSRRPAPPVSRRRLMIASQGWDLGSLLVSILVFASYHVWLYCFDTPVPGRFKVMKVTKNARRVWQRAIALNDKETVTGVQTLRCCGVAVAHA